MRWPTIDAGAPITGAAARASFRLGGVSDVEAVGTLCIIDRVATATNGVLDRSCRPMPSCTIRPLPSKDWRTSGGYGSLRRPDRGAEQGQCPTTHEVGASTPPAGNPEAKLEHVERCLERADPALARRFRTLERRHQRNDVAVFGLLVMSMIFLGAALATASWACFVAGATTFAASFVVDTRYQRALERGLDREEEEATWP
jgi:hypothetical protein